MRDQSINDIAKQHVDGKKYVILNEFVYHMKRNYDLAYTNSEAVDLLIREFGYTRKRIRFETINDIRQSRNEFIMLSLPEQDKPIIGEMITHDMILNELVNDILLYIRENFVTKRLNRIIINFNMFKDLQGNTILLFDNNTLKIILGEIMGDFNYSEKSIVQIATRIREISETSYVRQNSYNEFSINAVDKKFYTYTYKEKEQNGN